ncbi:hypothetical protein LRP88_04550 [Fusarium phalaenopsidis]|nr:HET domain-containing protein [Fusarium sp. Ph1]
MIDSTAGEPMKLEEDPASQQYELRLYGQQCEAGLVQRCNLCRSIARRRFPYMLNAEVSHFQASARECSVCAAVCDSLIGLQSSLKTGWNTIDLRFNASSKSSRFFASEVTPKDNTYQSFQIFTELSESPATCPLGSEPIVGAARSIAAESNSGQCFDLIRYWISECAQHPACAPPSFYTRLPTRLLDIPAGDGGCIKLYETHEEEKDMYIALSHCWGPKGLPDEAKTTNATRDYRKRGIRIEVLPKSFQDAITICHALGVRYLWIDSLCIIQQDKDDWEKECSHMRDVYRNSYLTISVARSCDSSEGCFSSRPTKHLSTKVGSINHQGQVYNIMAGQGEHQPLRNSGIGQSNFGFPSLFTGMDLLRAAAPSARGALRRDRADLGVQYLMRLRVRCFPGVSGPLGLGE